MIKARKRSHRIPLQLTAVTILLALTACQSAPPPPQCPYSNSHQCAQFLEAYSAKTHPELFSRTKGRLAIPLKNGNSKTYEDMPDEVNFGAKGEWYNFVRYYPAIGYGLISVQHYEGSKYFFLNMATGDQFRLDAVPEVSPDKKRIAVGNFDESDYTPNMLAVYLLRGNDLQVEFMARDMKWGAANIQWLGTRNVAFTRLALDANMKTIKTRSKLAYVRDRNEWKIQTE